MLFAPGNKGFFTFNTAVFETGRIKQSFTAPVAISAQKLQQAALRAAETSESAGQVSATSAQKSQQASGLAAGASERASQTSAQKLKSVSRQTPADSSASMLKSQQTSLVFAASAQKLKPAGLSTHRFFRRAEFSNRFFYRLQPLFIIISQNKGGGDSRQTAKIEQEPKPNKRPDQKTSQADRPVKRL